MAAGSGRCERWQRENDVPRGASGGSFSRGGDACGSMRIHPDRPFRLAPSSPAMGFLLGSYHRWIRAAAAALRGSQRSPPAALPLSPRRFQPGFSRTQALDCGGLPPPVTASSCWGSGPRGLDRRPLEAPASRPRPSRLRPRGPPSRSGSAAWWPGRSGPGRPARPPRRPCPGRPRACGARAPAAPPPPTAARRAGHVDEVALRAAQGLFEGPGGETPGASAERSVVGDDVRVSVAGQAARSRMAGMGLSKG